MPLSNFPDKPLSPEELVGKEVRILETEETRKHCIAGSPGYIESVTSDGKIKVICTARYFGPAGPYTLELTDVELKTKAQPDATRRSLFAVLARLIGKS